MFTGRKIMRLAALWYDQIAHAEQYFGNSIFNTTLVTLTITEANEGFTKHMVSNFNVVSTTAKLIKAIDCASYNGSIETIICDKITTQHRNILNNNSKRTHQSVFIAIGTTTKLRLAKQKQAQQYFKPVRNMFVNKTKSSAVKNLRKLCTSTNLFENMESEVVKSPLFIELSHELCDRQHISVSNVQINAKMDTDSYVGEVKRDDLVGTGKGEVDEQVEQIEDHKKVIQRNTENLRKNEYQLEKRGYETNGEIRNNEKKLGQAKIVKTVKKQKINFVKRKKRKKSRVIEHIEKYRKKAKDNEIKENEEESLRNELNNSIEKSNLNQSINHQEQDLQKGPPKTVKKQNTKQNSNRLMMNTKRKERCTPVFSFTKAIIANEKYSAKYNRKGKIKKKQSSQLNTVHEYFDKSNVEEPQTFLCNKNRNYSFNKETEKIAKQLTEPNQRKVKDEDQPQKYTNSDKVNYDNCTKTLACSQQCSNVFAKKIKKSDVFLTGCEQMSCNSKMGFSYAPIAYKEVTQDKLTEQLELQQHIACKSDSIKEKKLNVQTVESSFYDDNRCDSTTTIPLSETTSNFIKKIPTNGCALNATVITTDSNATTLSTLSTKNYNTTATLDTPAKAHLILTCSDNVKAANVTENIHSNFPISSNDKTKTEQLQQHRNVTEYGLNPNVKLDNNNETDVALNKKQQEHFTSPDFWYGRHPENVLFLDNSLVSEVNCEQQYHIYHQHTQQVSPHVPTFPQLHESQQQRQLYYQQQTITYEHMFQQFQQDVLQQQQFEKSIQPQRYTPERIYQLEQEDQQISLQQQHDYQIQTQLLDQLQEQQIQQQQPPEKHEHQKQFIAYLHRQQQQLQLQEVYHTQQEQSSNEKHTLTLTTPTATAKTATSVDDLMIEEFREDPSSTAVKLLSPTTTKHENQDDGYETSAGDVLTPNSYSSSTHSLTPQHQIQHTSQNLTAPSKVSALTIGISGAKRDPQQHRTTALIPTDLSTTFKLNSNHIVTTTPYKFMNNKLPVDVIDNSNIVPTRGELFTSQKHDGSALSPTNPVINNGFLNLPEMNMSIRSQTRERPLYSLQQQHYRQTELHETKESETSKLQNHTSQPGSLPPQLSPDQNQAFINDAKSNIGNSTNRNISKDTSLLIKPPQKRRGRKKKNIVLATAEICHVDTANNSGTPTNIKSLLGSQLDTSRQTAEQEPNGVFLKIAGKDRKKHDRFDGMSEEEVVKRTLPDHLCDNLDIVIIGINPGLFAAYKGHHYAGPGNHFWKCLYLSGLTQEQMSAEEDYKLMNYGIGFTNMVQRATKGSADLTRKEIKEGSRILLEKLQRFRPKIAVFNGKLIFEVFSGKKDFNFGRQSEYVDGTNTYIWVMPSSSARCAQLPRAADKVPFYTALKKYRDFLNGLISHMDESECIFTEQRIKQICGELQPEQLTTLSASATNQTAGLSYENRNKSTQQNSSVSVPPHQQFSSDDSYTYSATCDNIAEMDNKASRAGANGIKSHQLGPGPPDAKTLIALPTTQLNGTDGFNVLSCYHGPSGQLPQLEKKKRGRPKKLKGQEIIDPTTGQKLQLTSNSTDYNSSILNLSLMGGENGGCLDLGGVPKKKRGRPKKLKLPTDILHAQQQHIQQNQMQQQNKQSNISHKTVQPSGHDHTISPTLIAHQQQSSTVLYSTSPLHLQPPVHSPTLICSYNAAAMTPPNSGGSSSSQAAQQSVCETDAIISVTHKSSNNNNYFCNSGKMSNNVANTLVDAVVEHRLGDSPPPTSPHICAVDFEPPVITSPVVCRKELENNLDTQQRQQIALQQRMQLQQQRYSSPVSGATTWASQPSPQQHQFCHHQQQMQHYQEQQQLHQHMHELQHSQQQQQQSWQRHQQHQYEDMISVHHSNNPFLLSPTNQQMHQQQPTTQALPPHHGLHQPQLATDLATKSLSGLESLVDQIPTISDTDSGSIAAAAAASVENRLQGLQQQPMQQQEHILQHFAHSHVGADNTADSLGCASHHGSGSNTPHTLTGLFGAGTVGSNSPGGNYPINRLNSTSASSNSSPALMSPHSQHSHHPQHQYSASHLLGDMPPPSTPTTPTAVRSHGSPSSVSTASGTSAITCGVEHDSTPVDTAPSTIISNAHNSNFSVNNLAASAVAHNNNESDNSNPINIGNIDNYNSTASYLHHPNLVAAATLAAAAANVSDVTATYAHPHHNVAHSQMYMNPHISQHHHVPVNSMYAPPPPPPPSNNHHSSVSVYNNSNSEYISSPYDASTTNGLHIPSLNYPYGYGTPSTGAQASYMNTSSANIAPGPSGAVSAAAAAAAAAVAGYHHHSHTHSAHHHSHHSHAHAHASHGHYPLSMFNRLKPDLGSYSGF